MKQLSKYDFNRYKQKFHDKKKAPHSKAALVDEIQKVVGKSQTYNYPFWLRQLKVFEDKGGSVATVLDWLKQIDAYPVTFNKGGSLTNKFKNYGRDTVQPNREESTTISSKEEK